MGSELFPQSKVSKCQAPTYQHSRSSPTDVPMQAEFEHKPSAGTMHCNHTWEPEASRMESFRTADESEDISSTAHRLDGDPTAHLPPGFYIDSLQNWRHARATLPALSRPAQSIFCYALSLTELASSLARDLAYPFFQQDIV